MIRERDVIVLCEDAPTENDRRAHAIAEFVGANVESVRLRQSGWDTFPRSTCLLVAADTLANAVEGVADVAHLSSQLAGATDNVVVYGFRSTDSHAALLRALSADAVTGIQPLSHSPRFSVADGYGAFCGAVSGLSLGHVDTSRDHGFACVDDSSRLETMIRAGDTTFLASTELGHGRTYFVGSSELADLDEPVRRGSDVVDWFSRLAPVMMVLRGALGDRVWRNPSPRACFIIDDPLLTKRYGFLEYDRLVDTMRPHRFFPCIAFIPWNYERSRKDVAAVLSSQYAEPFLCVHGCDHTRAEFATTDARTLESKSQLALERMRQQARVNEVPFDDVMVFPQGLFSSEAVAALKTCGYLAAVNSDVCPSTPSSQSLCLRDLLDVAVTKFADFPLFGRRYPHDAAALAFDLFLGKPALVVEHHGYFRDGYSELASFVERLNALEPRLEWASLGSVCSRACLTRTTADRKVHVRFFTNRFSLSNDGSHPQSYVLTRFHASAGPSPVLTVNDRDWPSEVIDGQLTLRVTLDAGETARIEVGAPTSGHAGPATVDTRYAARVRLRRYLSEFRDNYVDTNPALHAVIAAARTARRDVRIQFTAPRAVSL